MNLCRTAALLQLFEVVDPLFETFASMIVSGIQ
jgi:hypothetical protein